MLTPPGNAERDTGHGVVSTHYTRLLFLLLTTFAVAESGTSNKECRFTVSGTGYLGDISVTAGGKLCQKWSSQTPHAHPYTDPDMFPDETIAASGASCRNPDPVNRSGPWCYTTTGSTDWDYCNVPICDCLVDPGGYDYAGKISTTESGRTCQLWASQSPHGHSFTDPDLFVNATSIGDTANYCRNPDHGWGSGVWCYTTDPNMRWEHCNVPRCECKHTEGGVEYIGNVSRTQQGYTCQRWDMQTPHQHPYDHPSYFPDSNMTEVQNFCRNPDLVLPGGPWCLTTEANFIWDYCNIPLCETLYSWPTPAPTIPTTLMPHTGTTPLHHMITEAIGVSKQECRFSYRGTAYSGRISRTISGLKCQRWDSTSPHDHSEISPDAFPEDTVSDAANYCRNPDRDPWGPWCFTTDPNVLWDYCDIPQCDCRQSRSGIEYEGKTRTTRSGKICQAWSVHSPHRHNFDDPNLFEFISDIREAENYCRNPDNDPQGPWCFTTDENVRWEFCDISFCECRQDVAGTLYEGQISKTRSGQPCQSWSAQQPHAHSFNHDDLFPDPSVGRAKNFCRNPDVNEPDGAWCFTTSPSVQWEYCDVPLCELIFVPPTPAPTTQPSPTQRPIDWQPHHLCRENKHGRGYVGNLSHTQSGHTCQRWDSQNPHVHYYFLESMFPDASVSDAANFCRNPDAYEPEGPWCFTTDPKVPWDYCDIPYCECKMKKDGKDYGGTLRKTVSGRTCQRWDSQQPHEHRVFDSCMFPDLNLAEAENFCRNPDIYEPNGPWCFTSDPDVLWEYCQVPLCPNEARRPSQPTQSPQTTVPTISPSAKYVSVTPAIGAYATSPQLSSGHVTGIVMSVLVVLMVAGVAAAYFLWRRYKAPLPALPMQEDREQGPPMGLSTGSFENPMYKNDGSS